MHIGDDAKTMGRQTRHHTRGIRRNRVGRSGMWFRKRSLDEVPTFCYRPGLTV